MEHISTNLTGCFLLVPRIIEDDRGSFREVYRASDWSNFGVAKQFCQENMSISKMGTARGLHFQRHNPQAKLVTCLKGEILDIVVDLRINSPTYGKHATFILSEKNEHQLYVPAEFAHGFVALEDDTKVHYKCDQYWDKASDGGIYLQDFDLGFPWDLPTMKISQAPKDLELPCFDPKTVYNFTYS